MYLQKSHTRIWLICIVIILGLFGLTTIHTPVSQAANKLAIMPTPVIACGQTHNTRVATDLKKVVVGSSWMLGILHNDTLVAWGDNRFWQSTIPYRYKDTLFKDVAAGLYVAYALDMSGNVVAWGESPTYHETTIPLAAQTGVTAIAAGGNGTQN